MKTNKGFIVNWSKDDTKIFCWFVRHPLIDKGYPRPINTGDLEWYLNKCKKKIAKTKKIQEKTNE